MKLEATGFSELPAITPTTSRDETSFICHLLSLSQECISIPFYIYTQNRCCLSPSPSVTHIEREHFGIDPSDLFLNFRKVKFKLELGEFGYIHRNV